MSNLHLWWGELLLDALARAGVRQVVVSPGSRSTPLALAARRHPHLATTVVVDERCAGFVALGHGRATGLPAVALCTSGSAGAHYLPAVVEASEASVPLLLVTADRPPELQGRGALQTTRQHGLFAAFVRAAWELGVPDPHPAALAGVRATAAAAVQATLDPRPGPVHLNAPFRPPLEPQPEDPAEGELRRRVASLLETPVARTAPPRRRAAPELLDALAAACRAARRGLVVCGPASLGQTAAAAPLAALARRLGFPVVAEAGSQLRFCPSSPAPLPMELLAGPAAPPHDLALVLGSWPTSAAWSQLLTRPGAPRPWVLCEHGWVDPHNCAAALVVGAVEETLERLLARLGPGEPREPRWGQAWGEVAAWAEGALAAAERGEQGEGTLSELGVVRAVVRALPPGTVLALGNSLVLRDVDLACPAGGKAHPVLTQRGLSGIDGGISAAAGAALALRVPLALLLGDVAFQHDVGGLAAATDVDTPMAVVVLDNGGGRIFDQLPVAGAVAAAELEALFRTPPRLDVEAAARAFGLRAQVARRGEEVEAAVRAALQGGGCTVVRVGIQAPAGLAYRRALREQVQARWRRLNP